MRWPYKEYLAIVSSLGSICHKRSCENPTSIWVRITIQYHFLSSTLFWIGCAYAIWIWVAAPIIPQMQITNYPSISLVAITLRGQNVIVHLRRTLFGLTKWGSQISWYPDVSEIIAKIILSSPLHKLALQLYVLKILPIVGIYSFMWIEHALSTHKFLVHHMFDV